MPNSRTFSIKPIEELIHKYAYGKIIVPFANSNKLATITNDLDTQYNTDYHMDALDFLKMFEDEWDYVLIPDCRFPNEIIRMKTNFDCIHLSVFRPNFNSPLTPEQQKHPSETALDNYPCDEVLWNDGSVENLGVKILKLVERIDNAA